MKRWKKILAEITLAAGMMIAVTGCSTTNDTEGKVNVRIAYFPNITHTQALVMKNQGTLEELWGEECEVTWTSFNAGPEEIEALFAEEIDLGYIGPVPALNANVKSNGEIKILSNATDAGAVLLKRKDAEIGSMEDLAGKTVAVPQLGNTQHLCLLNLLEENGLKTIDEGGTVTVTASSNADILNLLENGSVDAALVPEPWGTTMEAMENAEVLLDADEIFLEGNYPTAVVVVREEFLEAYPELVEEFLSAHEDATIYINGNEEEARNMVNAEIEEATGKALEEEVLQGAFSRMRVSTQMNEDAIMKFAEISYREGFIDKIPEIF